jgi:hypothetical protein
MHEVIAKQHFRIRDIMFEVEDYAQNLGFGMAAVEFIYSFEVLSERNGLAGSRFSDNQHVMNAFTNLDSKGDIRLFNCTPERDVDRVLVRAEFFYSGHFRQVVALEDLPFHPWLDFLEPSPGLVRSQAAPLDLFEYPPQLFWVAPVKAVPCYQVAELVHFVGHVMLLLNEQHRLDNPFVEPVPPVAVLAPYLTIKTRSARMILAEGDSAVETSLDGGGWRHRDFTRPPAEH